MIYQRSFGVPGQVRGVRRATTTTVHRQEDRCTPAQERIFYRRRKNR